MADSTESLFDEMSDINFMGAFFTIHRALRCRYFPVRAWLDATCAILFGRQLTRKNESNKRFAAIDRTVANEGWTIVGLIRLSPVFPFRLLNDAFDITPPKPKPFARPVIPTTAPGSLIL